MEKVHQGGDLSNIRKGEQTYTLKGHGLLQTSKSLQVFSYRSSVPKGVWTMIRVEIKLFKFHFGNIV